MALQCAYPAVNIEEVFTQGLKRTILRQRALPWQSAERFVDAGTLSY